jgi:hypothetical protein
VWRNTGEDYFSSLRVFVGRALWRPAAEHPQRIKKDCSCMLATTAVRFLYATFCLTAVSLVGASNAKQVESAGEDWAVLDRAGEYPASYGQRFEDSLLLGKQFSFAQGLRSIPGVPFVQGERFVYDVGWGPLRAGFIILETTLDSNSGRLTVVARGMTNNFFSAFYKVRDFMRTTMDPQGIYPFFFEQHLREGRFKDNRWELFDQASRKVYSHKSDTAIVDCPPFVQDFLSLVMYLRSLTFSPGDSFYTDCFVEKRSHRIVSHCVDRKSLKVDAGEFNCLLVKPVLVGEGRVFTKKDEVRLWLTDDAFKMPVMVSAKIAVGSITARLVWYERKAEQK